MKMVKEHVKKLTRLFIPTKDHDKPLKRSLSGYETENFILNNDGSIDHSDPLLKKAQKQKLNVQAECAKSMIEVICFPYRKLSSTSKEIVNSHIKLTEIAEKNNKHIYPFATYFGINKPSFRQGGWYTVKEKVLGKERFTNAGLCCGFHQHYTLPTGMFDHKTKMHHYKLNSKVKKTIIGKVTNYYKNNKVAAIKLYKEIKIGDKIMIQGNKTGTITTEVTSLQIEHSQVKKARGLVGLKLDSPVRENDTVFKID